MKITKRQLKQIIKEELEVVLTNEEAEEMFGQDIRAQLEENVLQEDLSQLASMLGSNPEELMIVLKALGLTAANLGGAVGAGMGMSKIIDMIRDYRERKAPPEDEQLTEVEYGEDGPMYYEPVEGERSPEDAEVLVRGYGGLRIDQIRRKLSSMAEKSAKGDLRELESAIKSGVVPAFLETLKIHSALGPPIG